jgi:hypothetical protein
LTSSTPIGTLAKTVSDLSTLPSTLETTLWIIDSGASKHMTGLFYLFTCYSTCSCNKIRIVDVRFSPIAGKEQNPI